MIQRNYKYFGGVIESQFELIDCDLPLTKSINGQHKIQLQPIFRIFEFQEISKEDFDKNAQSIAQGKFLKHTALPTESNLINFIPVSQKDITSKPFDLAYLLFENAEPNRISEIDNKTAISEPTLWVNTFIPDGNIEKYKFSLPLTPFLVNNKNHKHGRLHAKAIIRTYEEIEIPEIETPAKNEKKCDYVDKNMLTQCENTVPTDVKFCEKHSNVITGPSQDGCFGDGCFGGTGSTKRLWDNYLSPIGLDYSNTQGCFRGRTFNPVGCFSSAVPIQSRLGCGLSSLLGLIAFLWLLFCLLFGNCGGCNDTTSKIEKNTDTVYVEVFRELKDTLKIVKNFVDSTTTNNYEMVSLPNVQFFTDSDKLLPSSAKELQALAEYLIKNDSLQATILGHTDNTGDSKANLDLSQRRAESVKKFLVNIGVKDSNLKAIGKGDTEPKAPNTTKEGRLMNRRVEVKLQQNQISKTKRIELPDSTTANM